MRALFIVIFLLIGIHTFGQQTFTISGTVSDKTETLPGASVYVSGYKIATVTNNEGKFILPALAPGSYDLLVKMIGYLPYSKKIDIRDQNVEVSLKLVENTTHLKEVVIKADPNRAFYIDLFKTFFIGKTPNASQCKILNTNVLQIDEDARRKTVTITASDFIVLENQALGYRIKYLLEKFEYNFAKKNLFYAGFPTYEDMQGSASQQKRWLKNRATAYNGSPQHFFRALYQNKVEEEGFVIYKRYEGPNPKRLPDSVISKLRVSESLNALKEPKTKSFIDKRPVLTDTLVKPFNNNLKLINFKDELYVVYKNEREDPGYSTTAHYQPRFEDLENYQISAVQMLIAPICFYANGLVVNPNSTFYSGYWSYQNMADAVPIDYIAEVKKP